MSCRNDHMDIQNRSVEPIGTCHLTRTRHPRQARDFCGGHSLFWALKSLFWASVWDISPLPRPLAVKVIRADRIMHGKTSRIFHDGRTFIKDLPNPFEAIRYHSLIVEGTPCRNAWRSAHGQGRGNHGSQTPGIPYGRGPVSSGIHFDGFRERILLENFHI